MKTLTVKVDTSRTYFFEVDDLYWEVHDGDTKLSSGVSSDRGWMEHDIARGLRNEGMDEEEYKLEYQNLEEVLVKQEKSRKPPGMRGVFVGLR